LNSEDKSLRESASSAFQGFHSARVTMLWRTLGTSAWWRLVWHADWKPEALSALFITSPIRPLRMT